MTAVLYSLAVSSSLAWPLHRFPGQLACLFKVYQCTHTHVLSRRILLPALKTPSLTVCSSCSDKPIHTRRILSRAWPIVPIPDQPECVLTVYSYWCTRTHSPRPPPRPSYKAPHLRMRDRELILRFFAMQRTTPAGFTSPIKSW
jgi:hypothetical protein